MEPAVKLLRVVITRGIGRDEARPDVANRYILVAVQAGTTYRSKLCASEGHGRDLKETIDQLSLPLLRPTDA